MSIRCISLSCPDSLGRGATEILECNTLLQHQFDQTTMTVDHTERLEMSSSRDAVNATRSQQVRFETQGEIAHLVANVHQQALTMQQ